MTAADKSQLDALAGGVGTDITVVEGASTVQINSSTGGDDLISAATPLLAGVMTATDKTKLDGIVNPILDGDFSSSGFMKTFNNGTYASRLMSAGDGINIANADGGLGNPLFSLDYSVGVVAPIGAPADGELYFRYT